MIARTWQRLKGHIPKDQAAYQTGRSTTEQVFVLKILAEKAITSQNFHIFFRMIDMSAAFDTISRSQLISQLSNRLKPNEMRMVHLLITDVKLYVRVGKTTGKEIMSNIGVAQGDCLSALLFIFYLAYVIHEISRETTREDHRDRVLWSALDWVIDRAIHRIEIDPKYADGLTFIRSDKSQMRNVKRAIPQMLSDGNLEENKSKREDYDIPSTDDSWKKCKFLGSMIDTENDCKNRTVLAAGTMTILKDLFSSHTLSIKTKVRIFEGYVSSIFLYNSELWVVDQILEGYVSSIFLYNSELWIVDQTLEGCQQHLPLQQ